MSNPFHSQSPYGHGRVSIGPGPLTPGIKALIIACVVVFFVQAVLPGYEFDQTFGLSSYGLIGQWRAWQPVTYLFLHSTDVLFHLIFNMLMLWMFGTELERRWGMQAFLQYYFFCGVGAGLLSVLLDVLTGLVGSGPLLSATYTLGASGAVFGLGGGESFERVEDVVGLCGVVQGGEDEIAAHALVGAALGGIAGDAAGESGQAEEGVFACVDLIGRPVGFGPHGKEVGIAMPGGVEVIDAGIEQLGHLAEDGMPGCAPARSAGRKRSA